MPEGDPRFEDCPLTDGPLTDGHEGYPWGARPIVEELWCAAQWEEHAPR